MYFNKHKFIGKTHNFGTKNDYLYTDQVEQKANSLYGTTTSKRSDYYNSCTNSYHGPGSCTIVNI